MSNRLKSTTPVTHTIAFLRMTAIQLRRIAERDPHVAEQLRHTANGLDAEAKELASLRTAGLAAAD